MPSLTAEALPALGCVRLVLDVRDMANTPEEVQLYRSTVVPLTTDWYTSLEKVRVRPTTIDDQVAQFGYPWELTSGGLDVWYDAECPLDTPVYYAAELVGATDSYIVAHPISTVLSRDFETGLNSWTADAGGTIAWNTTTPVLGTGSARNTANGGTTTIGVRSPRITTGIVAGHRYMFEYVVRASALQTDVRVAVDWLTAANTFLTSAFQASALIAPGGVAVSRREVFLAPATAARADFRVRWSGTPTAGHYLDIDRVRLYDLGVNTDAALPVTLASDGGGWLHTAELPAGALRLNLLPSDECVLAPNPTGVIFLSHEGDDRAGAGARFDVVDQALPSVVTARRKAPTSTLTVAALSTVDREAVHTELASGAVLMLRLPPQYNVPDRFLDVGDVKTNALSPDLRLPYRVIDMPYAQAPSPAAPTGGVLGERFEDLTRYPTWAEFDAANLTTFDVMLGSGSTVGVGVR